MSLLKTVYDGDSRPSILYRGNRYCGDSWCTGSCGLPALVVEGLKVHSNMVACGRVLQSFRVEWVGEKIEAQTEDHEALKKAWWA